MSEVEKPEEVQVITAANGTGSPENSGGEVVAEKTDEMENGVKAGVEYEKATHEKKHEDVKMVDAANVKVEDENVEGSKVEEAEPMKVEGEEKKTEEPNDGQESKEESEMAKEKDKEVDEKMKDVKEKGDMAEGKSEEGHEKDEESEEKVEEIKERGDVTKGESIEGDKEKESETEEEGEGAEEKSDEAEEKNEYNEDKAEENEEKVTRKERGRGRKVVEKDEGKQKKRSGKSKEVLRTPTTSSIDRPVRERKTVERLVEIVERDQDKGFLIEKGQGTPLKDIPNVAYKLSKKKPADIRSLHLLLFGRKGKAINYKSHIFQFSGFVWHENEDKQRAKLKGKLDKCVKDRLLDFCDVFDIQVSRATARKEDLVAKLLDFMVAPRATTDIVLAEKEELRKRKRVSRKSVLKRFVGISGRQSRKKRTKVEKTSKSAKRVIETEDEEEEENGENGLPDEDEPMKHSESEEEDEYDYDNVEKEDEYSGKDRQDTKKSSKKRGSPAMSRSKKFTTPKRTPLPASTKSPNKLHSKRFKTDEAKDSKEEVFPRKKKNALTTKRTPPSNSALKDKKTTGKKAGQRKAKSDQAEESGPTEEDLREKISEILKEVDFNTATFTDILRKLASHYNMDLTARKAAIKLMIQDELTKLAEDDEDDDGDGEDEGEDDADKVEDLEPTSKVEA